MDEWKNIEEEEEEEKEIKINLKNPIEIISEEDEEEIQEKNKKPKKKRVTKLEEKVNTVIFKLHFMKIMDHFYEKEKLCEDEIIQSFMLSLYPFNEFNHLDKIESWFKKEFQKINQEKELNQNILIQSIQNRQVNDIEFIILLVALYRSLGHIAKIIQIFKIESEFCPTGSLKKQEFFYQIQEKQEKIETIKREYPLFIYSFSNGSILKDVTNDFIKIQMLKTKQFNFRYENIKIWAMKYIQKYKIKDINIEEEEEEIPKTIQDCKISKNYVLEKDIPKYYAIYPIETKPIGKIKNYNIFERKYLKQLHSKDGWLKEGRKVKENETFFKLVKSPGSSSQMHTQLYGEWQTEEYIQLEAKDGKVPKNERNQVDLWIPKGLPIGTVHMIEPGLSKIAKKLGIDYAKVMMGFERRKGKSVPEYQGIVVCKEFEEILRKTWIENETKRNEKKEKDKEKKVIKNWRKMILFIEERRRRKDNIQVIQGDLIEEI